MENWLKNAVVYEVYPQSFYDSNGDGIGDLKGLIQKLDYIKDCGFNVIWLHPVNDSSFRDAGYDITDYYKVAPRYGTNEDFQEFCRQAHTQGIKVIYDLVAGHTSVDHPWFQESAKNEVNEYTNRYIWTKGTFDVGPGIRGYSQRDGNYIPNFFWSQPSLNYGYANPTEPWQLPVDHPDCIATKEELKKIMYFWMDMGVDGFRVDLASTLIKGDKEGSITRTFWQELKAHVKAKDSNFLLVSEWGKPARAVWTGFDCDFLLHCYDPAYTSLFRYEEGRNITREYIGHSYFSKDGKGDICTFLNHFLSEMEKIGKDGTIGLITGNHDMPRIGYGRTQEDMKVAMTFLLTMPGVPFVYYGDEIGMDFIADLPSKEGGYARTGARTPMQWNQEKNHGFSHSDEPYLPTDSKLSAPTVEEQLQDKESLLNLVKQLVKLRTQNPGFSDVSNLKIIAEGYPFVYERMAGGKKFMIAVNPSGEEKKCAIPALKEIIANQNVKFEGTDAYMGGVSCFVAEVL